MRRDVEGGAVGGVSKEVEVLKGNTRTGSMPGVIMENGSRNGSHTNHDRDQRPNRINGCSPGSDKGHDKGKGRPEPQQNMTPISPTMPNGLNSTFRDGSQQQNGRVFMPQDMLERMEQLPPEIAHVTYGYMPLSILLSRLAQKTHVGLTTTIMDLAQMPIPASTINGNSSQITTLDDNSAENIRKKDRFLKFLDNAHTELTKALIITNWSRRSEEVNKIIDLRNHLFNQKLCYENCLDQLGALKRNLLGARLPNPDLKTALEVLTTGKASWMPEVWFVLSI